MASSSSSTALLRFEDGAVQFRQRLVLSIISCRPLLIKNIRNQNADSTSSFGLLRHEISFLRLVSSLTNGTQIEINSTGTQLRFQPGIFVGGEYSHDCPQPGGGQGQDGSDDGDDGPASHRSVGWFLEGILPLAPFGKEPLSLTLTGITDGTCAVDPSVDYLRASVLPLMKVFGIGSYSGDVDALLTGPQVPSLKVIRRGAAPAGGGCVHLYCPMVPKELAPVDYVDMGKVKRVRGTAVSTKVVSGSSAARAAYSCKGVLHRLLPDVWIHTDVHSQKQHKCGPSPSLSLVLTAESTTGVVHSTECSLDYSCSSEANDGDRNLHRRELPEDLGKRGAAMLLEEIRRGGCVDTGMQSLALVWMCLTPEDVSRIRVGTLSEYAIVTLRLLKLVLGVEFKVKADPETKTVVLSCLGIGYRNMARAST
jgi:RNA 3'-terminal phosphate cyclase-like protein